MVQGISSANKGLIASLVSVGLLTVIIGCGGGGAGGTGTTTATVTSGTAGTAGSTTATTAGTSTAGTTGNVSGSLPSDVLIYNFVDPNDPLLQSVLVDYISPDGTGNTSFSTFNNTSYALAAPNPNPNTAKTNAFAFAYMNPSTNLFDIFTNTTVSITGATQVTSKSFSLVSTIQFTPDGTKLVFTAISGSGTSQLFVVNIDGTQLRFIDSADDAYIAGDGVNVAYSKPGFLDNNVPANPIDEVFTVHIDGTQVRQITGVADNLDHMQPQWSKDSTRLCWAAGPSGAGFDVYASLPDGTQLTKMTSLAPDAALSPSFSGDGTKVGFVDVPQSDVTKAGVYYIGINGLGQTQITAQTTINPGLYWTSAVGTLIAGHGRTTPLFGTSHHVAVLKKLGKWHYK